MHETRDNFNGLQIEIEIECTRPHIPFCTHLGETVIIFKIGGFHGGDYEEWCLLGCYAVWFL
jgi:hypothetical protein